MLRHDRTRGVHHMDYISATCANMCNIFTAVVQPRRGFFCHANNQREMQENKMVTQDTIQSEGGITIESS